MKNYYKSVIFFFLACFLCHHVLPLGASASVNEDSKIPAQHGISAVFAFGDSTLDPGNNDHIATVFRGDHLPYGRDLPRHQASGRFTNGKLMLDFVVKNLGLKDLLPAYLDRRVTDRELLTGVSFASAGTGLDDLTATISNVLPMSAQLDHFQQALGRIHRAVGTEIADEIVNNALFTIGVGTNDLIWNFYDLPTRRGEFLTVSSYHDFLLGRLESVVQRLYRMGARKFSISGLPPIGCLPVQVTAGSILPSTHLLQRVCVGQQNFDSQSYNAKLQGLISRLQARLPGSKVAYVDIYNPLVDMIHNPHKYGFQETTRGCCGTGMLEMGSLCNSLVPTCPDASKFVFWDAVHPTQATYQVLAHSFMANVVPRLMN
ncbi:GDSL esterase/lipase [Thalictrum thalictroides]|uniref:GDSL esterase/lipase n=1 Tax=Thalictrum thalictroides TaxID=46969 RepID=A0A7J6VY45_THATH|nr:GDSL esterase/lipase [Thalictrum thalictroides]